MMETETCPHLAGLQQQSPVCKVGTLVCVQRTAVSVFNPRPTSSCFIFHLYLMSLQSVLLVENRDFMIETIDFNKKNDK